MCYWHKSVPVLPNGPTDNGNWLGVSLERAAGKYDLNNLTVAKMRIALSDWLRTISS